ncbi:rRNA biogenesis protein rrp36 [Tilletia horrida]|uniref:rRNA biogenesis protein RRP36 n=1 Tax=Tilletia horrida TaxID=155126 RepID=A0AAN6GQU4_9BASI|nr:rRNA biogenesis protein rrp36 [Tilletia horrida]KAK0569730.1 rRNA biogenesis protein rrp36 [Tilletia horrida]
MAEVQARQTNAENPKRRVDKSAPTEVSSKKPVTRLRQVIDVPKSHARDPRFDSLSTAPLDPTLFTRSYGFIDSVNTSELAQLKQDYTKLRRAVAARAPSDEKAAQGLYSDEAMALRAERDRVGQQIKRLESVVAEKERRAREADVKRNLRKVNEERQGQGQQPVYLKKSQLKGVLLQDKFERLASQGNKKSKGKAKAQPESSSSSSSSSQNAASNMSVDRLKAMISTRSETVPQTAAFGAGLSATPPDASSSAAIRKIMVRKAKKEIKKEKKNMPFAVRQRGETGGGSVSDSYGGGGAGEGEGSSVGKKRHRGSRGSGKASKKARLE